MVGFKFYSILALSLLAFAGRAHAVAEACKEPLDIAYKLYPETLSATVNDCKNFKFSDLGSDFPAGAENYFNVVSATNANGQGLACASLPELEARLELLTRSEVLQTGLNNLKEMIIKQETDLGFKLADGVTIDNQAFKTAKDLESDLVSADYLQRLMEKIKQEYPIITTTPDLIADLGGGDKLVAFKDKLCGNNKFQELCDDLTIQINANNSNFKNDLTVFLENYLFADNQIYLDKLQLHKADTAEPISYKDFSEALKTKGLTELTKNVTNDTTKAVASAREKGLGTYLKSVDLKAPPGEVPTGVKALVQRLKDAKSTNTISSEISQLTSCANEYSERSKLLTIPKLAQFMKENNITHADCKISAKMSISKCYNAIHEQIESKDRYFDQVIKQLGQAENAPVKLSECLSKPAALGLLKENKLNELQTLCGADALPIETDHAMKIKVVKAMRDKIYEQEKRKIAFRNYALAKAIECQKAAGESIDNESVVPVCNQKDIIDSFGLSSLHRIADTASDIGLTVQTDIAKANIDAYCEDHTTPLKPYEEKLCKKPSPNPNPKVDPVVDTEVPDDNTDTPAKNYTSEYAGIAGQFTTAVTQQLMQNKMQRDYQNMMMNYRPNYGWMYPTNNTYYPATMGLNMTNLVPYNSWVHGYSGYYNSTPANYQGLQNYFGMGSSGYNLHSTPSSSGLSSLTSELGSYKFSDS